MTGTMLTRVAAVAALLVSLSTAQSSTERVISSKHGVQASCTRRQGLTPNVALLPQIGAAPSLTPTVYDPVAPDAQQCPGYTASNAVDTASGFTADLTLSGAHCQAYGNDIDDLVLEVQYQSQSRLNVKIYPKYIAPENSTQYILPASLVLEPEWDGETTANSSDLALTWTNDPTFQFKITRTSNDEELFSTYGHVIVYEDQFLELVTNMVEVGAGISGVSGVWMCIADDGG
ncbi:hypothetical protein LTR53_013743 [Teratosphaeriaceae sp. CCFEE 6253]|nr:hypothetical protein LTR53_013743 [Teratosphaeriaceae sp. CCFEE 6253]